MSQRNEGVDGTVDVGQPSFSFLLSCSLNKFAFLTACIRAERGRFTVKEVKDTLDSIKLADLKPLVSRVFDRGEGMGLLQGNLQFREVDRYVCMLMDRVSWFDCSLQSVVWWCL